MSNIPFWSPTAAQNDDAPPDGAPEGTTLIGDVNNVMREQMAAVRRQWNDAEWFIYGDGDKTPSFSFVSSTVIKVVAGAGAIGEYHTGRRVRYVGAATIYGTIQSSVVNAADLDVTVTWDSGNAINESFTLSLHILRADNSGLPEGVTFKGSVDVSNATLTLDNNQISGNKIDGGTISNFASTGINDNATSNALTIDANEIVTMQKQPSFFADNSATDSNVTGDGTVYTVIFNNETEDRNADYNSSTGVFTAPVAGKYLFTWGLRLSGLTSSHTVCSITAAGSVARRLWFGNPFAVAAADDFTRSGAFAVELAASNTVSITVQVSNGTAVVGVVGAASGAETFFSGALLN